MRVVICDDIQKDMETIRTALDIYAAAHPEYYVEIDEYNAAAAFAMNAAHYLLKPFTQEQFDAALDRAIKKTEDQGLLSLDFVRRISGNNIEMQGGAKIPVPRRSVEKVKRVYMEYCRKEAGK